MIRMRCGQCRKLLRFSLDLAGKQANCTACNALILVPVKSDPHCETRLDNPVLSKEVARQELIKFFCHFCGQRLGVSSALAGKQFTCPDCNELNHVPTNSDTLDEYEVVAPSSAAPSLSRIFPVIAVIAILGVGLLLYTLSGVFFEREVPTEKYSAGDRLSLSRTESLVAEVTGGKYGDIHIAFDTELVGSVEVLGVDSLGVPSEMRLGVERHLRRTHWAPERPKTEPEPDSFLAGKQLVLKPDGTLKMDSTSAQAARLVQAHNFGDWPHHHLTKWLFSELAYLGALSSERSLYVFPVADAHKVLASALFIKEFDKPKVSCKVDRSGDVWTLNLTLSGIGYILERKVKLTGSGSATYLRDQRMITEVRLEVTLTAKAFDRPEDQLYGHWRVHLKKKRAD